MQNKDDEFIFSSSTGDIVVNFDNNYAAQDTITLTNMSGGVETISIAPISSDQLVYTISSTDSINLDNIGSLGSFTIGTVEWQNSFPDFSTVEKMCEEYPGLAKAFENFKTVYKMVEQDWKGKMSDDQTNLF